jgi:hypothetical protein
MFCMGIGLVTCNIAGQPCGLLNLSACTTGVGAGGYDSAPQCSQVLIGMGGVGGTGGMFAIGLNGMGGDPGMVGNTGAGGAPMSMGAGGAATVAVAASVGAGAGDPEPTPQGLTCDDGSELSTYIRCLGMGPMACSERCFGIGAYCVEYAVHPNNPSIGNGALKQCMENTLSYTCTYCYDNGDVCTFIRARFGLSVGGCTNTRGKGCE